MTSKRKILPVRSRKFGPPFWAGGGPNFHGKYDIFSLRKNKKWKKKLTHLLQIKLQKIAYTHN